MISAALSGLALIVRDGWMYEWQIKSVTLIQNLWVFKKHNKQEMTSDTRHTLSFLSYCHFGPHRKTQQKHQLIKVSTMLLHSFRPNIRH